MASLRGRYLSGYEFRCPAGFQRSPSQEHNHDCLTGQRYPGLNAVCRVAGVRLNLPLPPSAPSRLEDLLDLYVEITVVMEPDPGSALYLQRAKLRL